MDHTHHICKSEEDTKKVAELIAPQLKPGMVIFLKGELGAGKTTLVRYLLKSLGYRDKVKSPTYNLVETHQLKKLTVHILTCTVLGAQKNGLAEGLTII